MLFDAYPVTIERLTIIGHSMGGLVARSACHYASQAGDAWLDRLADLIFLGSPHLGAPLERRGHRLTHSLTRVSYTQPCAAIGAIRSAGVKDLSHSYVRDEDWQKDEGLPQSSTPSSSVPTLDHIGHFLVAGSDAWPARPGWPYLLRHEPFRTDASRRCL